MQSSPPAGNASIEADDGPIRVCPHCGLSEAELRSDGRMGCAVCYDVFADLVRQAVAALHGVQMPPLPECAPSPPEPPPPLRATPSRDDATLPWPTRRAEPKPPPPSQDSPSGPAKAPRKRKA